MGDFKIRVVENIGEESLGVFGEPGREFEVVNGEFYDLECDTWNNDGDVFENVGDINGYFGQQDSFQTVFELVDEPCWDKEKAPTIRGYRKSHN